jgi:NADPH:quinone reductase
MPRRHLRLSSQAWRCLAPRPRAAVLSWRCSEVAVLPRKWRLTSALSSTRAGLDLSLAGGWLLVTTTAYCGLAEMARLRGGETVLVTAAAGGLGSTCVQVAKALGAGRVVGMASSQEKREFALRQGADDALGYEDPIPPVDVVLDGVGGTVFERVFSAVRPLGRIVLFGASSGQVPQIPSFDALRRRNVGILPFSLGMLRSPDPDRLAELAAGAAGLLRSGRVAPAGRTFALVEAARALAMLSSRQTMGKLLLAP